MWMGAQSRVHGFPSLPGQKTLPLMTTVAGSQSPTPQTDRFTHDSTTLTAPKPLVDRFTPVTTQLAMLQHRRRTGSLPSRHKSTPAASRRPPPRWGAWASRRRPLPGACLGPFAFFSGSGSSPTTEIIQLKGCAAMPGVRLVALLRQGVPDADNSTFVWGTKQRGQKQRAF